jgi:hypothetical protein
MPVCVTETKCRPVTASYRKGQKTRLIAGQSPWMSEKKLEMYKQTI